MITITKRAAEEISLSLHNPDAQGMLLRIAIVDKPEGYEYLLGLDERGGDDIHLQSSGIEYVVSYGQKQQLEGLVVDYDKVDTQQGYCFIFMNPNDPNYEPPKNPNAPKKTTALDINVK